jgi:Family of unknown function (DUF6941)
MRLDAFLLADAARVADDGKLYIHGGGVTKIEAPSLPWLVPRLSVALRFQVEDEDFDGWPPGMVRLVFQAPDRGEILHAVLPFPDEPPTGGVEGEEVFLQLVLNLEPLPVAITGAHRFELSLDERMLRVLPLPVVLADSHQ